MQNTGLYWFTNDLRLDDNLALAQTAARVNQMLCVYVVDPAWFTPNRYGQKSMGNCRWRFLQQTLVDLTQALEAFGQQLLIIHESPLDAIAKLITQYDIRALFRSQNAGFYENQLWQTLQCRYRSINFEELATHTLFSIHALPFSLADFPDTFFKFRKRVEPLVNNVVISSLTHLPPPPKEKRWSTISRLPLARESGDSLLFIGGASGAKSHLLGYFSTLFAQHL